ncbi:MAG: Deoxycytidine triphosphate deaminase [Candidatus Roizmanbacteria bacterium GW2011_GWA2_37_7]|uniref:Deoxycytidine triphosphate deaminase n=1 Tax=Candidatus Roizmanbacteria bacterium GW2011_GWA2_37_7 TaxID=1618481 RepID=A0A0G0JHL7_9BACT|nr:MAG: Deoxycytidine triphosphate deaminase [Candidatus Roizmanbacteria bacterium GW2011_GWA2_37_7]
MILTHDDIIHEIENGHLKIDPLNRAAIGPASVDLTVSNSFRIFKRIDHNIPVQEHTDYTTITKKRIVTSKYTIKPQELILGITEENVTLPTNIAGWLNSRSRFARLGLAVHITAPFIQPGESGKQVLEIYNAGPNNLDLYPGEKLCQIIFQYCKGKAMYQGQYQNQEL